MSELVYNIKNIFNTEDNFGCLMNNSVNKYFIPPYQRGYKWSSDNKNAPVWLLMSDLSSSFYASKMQSENGEYFLQYITLKKIENEHLEVIDGQQRLTTLSLIFSVFEHINSDCVNFTKNKLIYAIRDSTQQFINEYIQDNNGLQMLLNAVWDSKNGIYLNDKYYNEQDIFYLFQAVQKIYELINNKEDILDFYDYIKENVKIIVNKVEHYISSEKIFRNLNANKVPLTNAELIKGLILTKAARETDNVKSEKHFKEILEHRASMGRQWDEISHWVNSEAVKNFFFLNSEDSFESFLELFAVINLNYVQISDKNEFDLFNYIQDNLNKGNTAGKIFFQIKETFQILNDWINSTETYNLLGLIMYSGLLDIVSIMKTYSKEDKPELKKHLYNLLKNWFSKYKDDINEDLNYNNDSEIIRKILLFINILYKEGKSINLINYKFPFYKMSKDKVRSIEHIYPQNPKDVSTEQLNNHIALIKKDFPGIFSAYNIWEKENQYADAKIKEAEIAKGYLHSIGNLVLVTNEINSSLQNDNFKKKRNNLRETIIKKGAFVPSHTSDVFNKLYSNDGDISYWTIADIKSNTEEVISKIKGIMNLLIKE